LWRTFWELTRVVWITYELRTILAYLYIIGTVTFGELAAEVWITANASGRTTVLEIFWTRENFWTFWELAVVERIAGNGVTKTACFQIFWTGTRTF